MIFSICAGILLGMKLYVWTSIERPKQKEEKKQAEQKEFYDYIRKELVMSQQKQYELNLLKQKRDAQIQLEKVKQINREQGYSLPIESTKKYEDICKVPFPTEQQWKEKAKTICRDLWYGTGNNKTKDEWFEEMLNDPATTFYEKFGPDPLEKSKIVIKTKDKTYEFVPDGKDMLLRYE